MNQNKRYAGAVGKPSIGAKPTASATNKAQNTALGRGTRSTIGSGSARPLKASHSQPRGSWEGYMHGTSAHIQMNGSGYSAPAMQKARWSKASLRNPKVNRNPLSGVRAPKSNYFDSRMVGKADGSIAKLKKLTSLNKLF